MGLPDRRQRLVHQHVAVEHEEGVGPELVEGLAHAPRRPQQLRLVADHDLHAGGRPVQGGVDKVGHVMDVDHYPRAQRLLAQVAQLAREERLAADVHQRLWNIPRRRHAGGYPGPRRAASRSRPGLRRAPRWVTGGAGFHRLARGRRAARRRGEGRRRGRPLDRQGEPGGGRGERAGGHRRPGRRWTHTLTRPRPDVIHHLAGFQSSVIVSVTELPACDCARERGDAEPARGLQPPRPAGLHLDRRRVYGNDAPIPTPEDRIPAPLAPYGASKWAGEAYITTWSRANGIPHSVCRLGNPMARARARKGRPAWWRSGALFRARREADGVRPRQAVARLRPRLRRRQRDARRHGRGRHLQRLTGVETDVMGVPDALQRAAGTSIEPELAPLRPGGSSAAAWTRSPVREKLGLGGEDRPRGWHRPHLPRARRRVPEATAR